MNSQLRKLFLETATNVTKGNSKFPEGASRLSINALRMVHKFYSDPNYNPQTTADLKYTFQKVNDIVGDLGPYVETPAQEKADKDFYNKVDEMSDGFGKNWLQEATQHFANIQDFYQPGNEDNIKKVDWDFYRKYIPDQEYINETEKVYKRVMEVAKEVLERQILPKAFYETEEVHNDIYAYLRGEVSYFEDKIGLVYEDLERTKYYYENLKKWTAAELMYHEPRLAAAIQDDWDNDRWDLVDDDHPEDN